MSILDTFRGGPVFDTFTQLELRALDHDRLRTRLPELYAYEGLESGRG